LADLWLHASQPVSQRGILKQAGRARVRGHLLAKTEQRLQEFFEEITLPTFNQLVRKGRTAPNYKTASPALQASPRRALSRGARHARCHRRGQPQAGKIEVWSEETEIDCQNW